MQICICAFSLFQKDEHILRSESTAFIEGANCRKSCLQHTGHASSRSKCPSFKGNNIYIYILARFKIGARGLSEISRIYGTVRLGNVFSLVRTVGTVG